MKSKHQIFLKSIWGIVVVFFFSVIVFIRADKNKFSFDNIIGKIVYLSTSFQDAPNRHIGKYRYLQIENFPKTFEVFVGKDAGDFKPKLEKIDSLRIGDEIRIFFDKNFKTLDDPINRLVYFIDKRNQPYFIKGSWEKTLAYFGFGISMAILLLLIFLRRSGKII